MTVKFEPYQAKSILFQNSEPDVFYRGLYSLNPYMGCSMGCRYCYVQNKKHNVSSGLEGRKDSVVRMKINAPYLLEKRLAAKPDRGLIVLGESCEPYDRPEETYLITRNLLEILSKYDYPLHIITRSPLVLRDIDILKQINEKSSVLVTISIPLISKDMVAKLEAEAPPVKKCFKTLRSMNKAGIISGVAVSPLIPYITDGEEVVKILKKAAANSAYYAVFNTLSIKSYQREMIFSWLCEEYPHLLEPYQRLYADSENPSEEYIEKFTHQFTRIASDLGLRTSVPDDVITSEYRQEEMKFDFDQ